MVNNPDHAQLKKLLSISRRLNGFGKLGDVLQEIADSAADLTQSQGSSILLFEEETQQLYFAAAKSKKREELIRIRVPIERSVAGWVYNQNLPLKFPDEQIDPLIFRTVEQDIDKNTRNLLALPITYGDETLGTLEVINKIDQQDYNQEDQSILDNLASYAGTTIKLHKLNKNEDHVTQEREELSKLKSDFIALASHELRTPLGLVLGHATYLKEIIQKDIHRDQLEIIVENAERIKDIIDRLGQANNFVSDTARIRWQNSDLNSVLKNVVDSFQVQALELNINLKASIPENPIYIHCDAAKLSVAIGNVIKNGLIFSDAGQKVHIGLHKLPGHAHISVTDNGIGIPAEDIQNIFERFYQVEPHLSRSRGGMGLGLSVSKSIVETHGGYIFVESVLGQGSTFTILLPAKSNLHNP